MGPAAGLGDVADAAPFLAHLVDHVTTQDEHIEEPLRQAVEKMYDALAALRQEAPIPKAGT
jgi:hypothetical protein